MEWTGVSVAKEQILVFAAIGGRFPLDEVGAAFEHIHDVTVIYDYGGTGRLANKVLAGIHPDVFIAGSEKWALVLKEKGYVSNVYPIVKHIPVVIAPLKNNLVQSLFDITQSNLKLVFGDPDACAIGNTTLKILGSASINKNDIPLCAQGITVKQLILWVEQGVADASIVWRADALQSSKVRVVEIPAAFNHISYIPICRMKTENESEAVKKYIDFVLNEGIDFFEKHGFETYK
ncbi:molybdate ABC transporter substrate-binding protein [candidate division KSB1 bacterium]|nr:molybdate ABC transporter substrate-binding protein [candidate division KSB1 bacterium]